MIDIDKLKRDRNELLERSKAMLEAAEKENRNFSEAEEKEFRETMDNIDSLGFKIEAEEKIQSLELKNQTPAPPEGDGEFRSLGEFIKTVATNPSDSRLIREASEQSMGTPAKGGYLVPEKFSAMIDAVAAESAIIRPRATVIPPGDQPDAVNHIPCLDYSGGRNAGVSVSWIGEADTKPQTDATLTEIKLEPFELAAHVVVTDKLLANAPQVEAVLRDLLARAIVSAEETAFLQGVGTTQPTGIIGNAATLEIPRTTDGSICYTDIANMVGSSIGTNRIFIASISALPALMTMEDSEGHLVWVPNAAQGFPGTLCGIPVMLSERVPTLGNDGDLLLIDPKAYLIQDGRPLSIAVSEHVYFLNNETVIKIFKSVDGKPGLLAPVLLEDGETMVSPFVQLGAYSS